VYPASNRSTNTTSALSVLAEFIVPASEFVLADTLTAAPDMRIEIKRVIAGAEFVTPYFWAAGGDFETFENALDTDEMIHDVLRLEEHTGSEDATSDEEGRFYRVNWKTDIPNLVSAVSEAQATVLEAVTAEGIRWEIKALFPDSEALSRFYDYCNEHAFQLELCRVYRPDNPQEQAEYGVTEEQQEALVAAFHGGYFSVPRDKTLTELAEELDISRNALSARLRRGQRNLLANTLIHDN
jgi:predicted DNA binding protein